MLYSKKGKLEKAFWITFRGPFLEPVDDLADDYESVYMHQVNA